MSENLVIQGYKIGTPAVAELWRIPQEKVVYHRIFAAPIGTVDPDVKTHEINTVETTLILIGKELPQPGQYWAYRGVVNGLPGERDILVNLAQVSFGHLLPDGVSPSAGEHVFVMSDGNTLRFTGVRVSPPAGEIVS